MPFHDEYARITPFELAFPGESFAEEHLERIAAAAGAGEGGAALADPESFVSVPAVAETLHEIRDTRRPEGAEGARGADAVQKHALLLYHAYHFRRAGCPLYLLETGAARFLVETTSGWREGPAESEGGAVRTGESAGGRQENGARPSLPSLAGYLQLPRHLFWIGSSDEGTPEPVDGFFWSAPDGERIAVLVAAGIRRERPGFSVLSLPAVPLSDAGDWLKTEVRKEGRDFESALPGGEMERLYSLETAGEVLKLLARAFRHVERNPGSVREATPPREERGGVGGGAEEPAGAGTDGERAAPRGGHGQPETISGAGPASGVLPPRPSALPYRRITLDAEDHSGS